MILGIDQLHCFIRINIRQNLDVNNVIKNVCYEFT